MKTYETFSEPSEWSLSIQGNPSTFNGIVRVVRYKITVDPVDEPVEAIHERLEKLWVECDNMHHYEPLKREAKKHGYVFKGSPGEQRKRS